MVPRRATGLNDYAIILAGVWISGLGSWMTLFGISVWVYQATGSATAYATLVFFLTIPRAAGSLIAGPYVDRWNRRWTLIASDLVAALCTLGILVLYSTDKLQQWHLYVAFTISGLANAFSAPAFAASIPLLTPREQLGRVAGIGQVASALIPIIAAPLASLLLAQHAECGLPGDAHRRAATG
jgi:MFS family permease